MYKIELLVTVNNDNYNKYLILFFRLGVFRHVTGEYTQRSRQNDHADNKQNTA